MDALAPGRLVQRFEGAPATPLAPTLEKRLHEAPSVLSEPPDEDGPWYFAWVPPEETTFNEELHARVDEWVFSTTIEHKEGDNPTATLEIENPGVGLLASGRLSWMWISKRKADNTVVPLFFGQLMSIPSDLLQTVVTITLVARPNDQEARKFALAQTLKVPPYYDEVWVDPGQQNNPDAVLEGYSSRWHFDRTTMDVTISDVLEGEDGILEFTYDDLFWDGMNLTIDNVPLSSVSVRATVHWAQKANGTIQMPAQNFVTKTGDGFMSDWPKAGSSLGGGWSAGASRIVDAYNTANAATTSYSISWHNKEKTHRPGDQLTSSRSETYPTSYGPFNLERMSEYYITSYTAHMSAGGPPMTFAGITTPATEGSASLNISYFVMPIWLLSARLELRYEANRERKEVINLTLVQDIQDVLARGKKNKENSDRLAVNGRDVGQPLSIRAILRGTGGNVHDGDQVLILADPPYRFQTTLTSGEGHVHIGATLEDSLRNLVNAINVNGLGEPGVDYAAENDPNETVSAAMHGVNGVLLTASTADDKILVSTTSNVLIFEAPSTYEWTGGNPVIGQTTTVGDIVYTFVGDLKTQMGQVTLVYNIIVPTPYHVLINFNSAEGTLLNFAAAINAEGGADSQYTVGTLQNTKAQAEVINGILTVFPRHADAGLTVSGPWSSETDHLIPDQSTVPIGDVGRRSYFATDRGQQSVQALIHRARARLRITARAVKASFVTDLEKGFDLSLRKNAILNDPRFAGGQAMGKVISYYFKCNGDDGAEIAGGEVGCAVGNGNTLVDDPGTPTYVDVGYSDPGWQMYSHQQVRLGANDIWYTPPVDTPPADDGLTFPLTLGQSVLSSGMTRNHADQQEAIDQVILAHPADANNQKVDPLESGVFATGFSGEMYHIVNSEMTQLTLALQSTYMVYELVLAPLDGGPYSTRYEVVLSDLMIPKQVDLSAE